jgi:hypothetical protein
MGSYGRQRTILVHESLCGRLSYGSMTFVKEGVSFPIEYGTQGMVFLRPPPRVERGSASEGIR